MPVLATLRRRLLSNQVVIDAVVAGVLTIMSLYAAFVVAPDLGISYRALDVLGIALLGLQTLPLVFRKTHPTAVLAVAGTSITVFSALGYPPGAGGIAIIFALYSVAANTDRRTALSALAVTVVGILISIAGTATSENLMFGELVATVVANSVIYGTAWIIGDNVRVRRAYTGALEARNALLEREREEHALRAVADERARIARELHDIVAHHVSVMVVQAAAARRVLTRQPDLATSALNDVEATGRQALVELRRMLGVLRSDDAADELLPQPSLEHLDSLVAQLRDTGLAIDLRVEGRRRPLPPGIDVNAYRIVQEALTNVLKHAGTAAATVCVRFGERELELEIVDDGRGAAAAILAPVGEGHGIVGMRERAQLHGGTVEAGPIPTGGYRVRARLPIDPAEADPERAAPSPASVAPPSPARSAAEPRG